jgi:hypothetical protein
MANMHASWKIASSALLSLVLAGAAGCAASGEDTAGDGASLAAAEADVAPGPAHPGGPPGDVVIVNINSNDHLGGHHHHGGGWGGHGGHHTCGNGPSTAPATPLPALPPPPPPAPAPPG